VAGPGIRVGGALDPLASFAERDASDDDVDALYRLHEQTMRAYVALTYGPWEDGDQRRRFREAFVSRRTRVLVESDGTSETRAASARIVAAFQIERRAGQHFLSSIEVAAGYQGRGIGSAIVRRFVEEARASGAEATLQVLKSNSAARRLYERLGFVVTGDTTTHDAMRAMVSSLER